MSDYNIPRYRIKLVKDSEGKVSNLPCHAGMASAIFTRLMRDIPHEEVWILLLDARSHITGSVKIAQGGVSGVGLTGNDILRPGIVHNARGIILGHNHPSGDCTPSDYDLEFTRQIVNACNVVQLPVVDHIVVTDDVLNYYSIGTRQPWLFG